MCVNWKFASEITNTVSCKKPSPIAVSNLIHKHTYVLGCCNPPPTHIRLRPSSLLSSLVFNQSHSARRTASCGDTQNAVLIYSISKCEQQSRFHQTQINRHTHTLSLISHTHRYARTWCGFFFVNFLRTTQSLCVTRSTHKFTQ